MRYDTAQHPWTNTRYIQICEYICIHIYIRMYLQLLDTLKLEGLPNNTTWFSWNEGPMLAEIVYKIDSLLIWAAACCTYGMASAAWRLLILVSLVSLKSHVHPTISPSSLQWHVVMVYSSKVILHVLLIVGNHLAICWISIELQVDILARSPINICFPEPYPSISSLQTVLDRLI